MKFKYISFVVFFVIALFSFQNIFSQDIEKNDYLNSVVNVEINAMNQAIDGYSKKELKAFSKFIFDGFKKYFNLFSNLKTKVGEFETKLETINYTNNNLEKLLIKTKKENYDLKIDLNYLKTNLIKFTDSLKDLKKKLEKQKKNYSEAINQIKFNLIKIDSTILTKIGLGDNKIIKNNSDFLNKLYLDRVKINDQTLKLVPYGIVAKKEFKHNQKSKIESGYGEWSGSNEAPSNYEIKLLSDLLISVNSSINLQFRDYEPTSSLYAFTRSVYTDQINKLIFNDFYTQYYNIFPQLVFTQGKLVSLEDPLLATKKDYLFEISKNEFKITNLNQVQYKFNTLVYEDEVYVYIDNTISSELFNISSPSKISFKSSFFYTSWSYYDSFLSYMEGIRKSIDREYNDNKGQSVTALYLDDPAGTTLRFFSKDLSIEKMNPIIPEGFLYKLEEVN